MAANPVELRFYGVLFFEAGILFSQSIRQLIGARRIAASHSNLIRIANQIRS
jgi:hypothetical protein